MKFTPFTSIMDRISKLEINEVRIFCVFRDGIFGVTALWHYISRNIWDYSDPDRNLEILIVIPDQ